MPSPISHIKQRTDCDCVVATVAMIANLPYRAVADLAPDTGKGKGLRAKETHRLLEVATGVRWRNPRLVYFRRLKSFCTTEDTLVLSVRQPQNLLVHLWKLPMRHCIAVREGQIYDPQFPHTHSIDSYPNAKWMPTIVYRPVDMGQLADIQRDNEERFRDDRLWGEILIS